MTNPVPCALNPVPCTLIIYSDYLCPWCYNASVRLCRVRAELGDAVRLEWRSFLLRPEPRPRRDLDRFREYTRSWLRPAAEPDSATFRVWQTDAGPPSHSVPPHLVAKAAAALGEKSFDSIHERLLYAYFAENRDITDDSTLRAIWEEAGLPAADFERAYDPAVHQQVLGEYAAAIDAGVTGVPAVQMEGNEAVIVGAHPAEFYRRWVERVRDR